MRAPTIDRARRRLVRLAPLLCALAVACGKPAGPASAPREPVALVDTRDIDPEVLELAARKLDEARRAPADARAHGSLGLAYAANGLWDAAERSLANAAALDPREPAWRFHRALALREAGDTDGSYELMEALGRETPDAAHVLHRLGQWRLDSGDTAGARDALARILARSPDQPELLVSLAAVELAEERWQAAADACRKALRRDPQDKLAHYRLGQALLGLGRAGEAERELALGVGARPRFVNDPLAAELAAYRVNYVNQLADATRLMLANQHAQALPIVERVHAKRPDDVFVINNLAACLQETGNPQRALELLERAAKLDEDEFGTYLNLADTYLRLGRHDDALRASERALELAPGLGRAHFTRARVLVARERFEEAYAALQQSLKLEPGNPSTPLFLCEVATRLKRFDEAGAWARKALAADPASVPARMSLASLALRAGAFDEARAYAQELARLAPDDERVGALRREVERIIKERSGR